MNGSTNIKSTKKFYTSLISFRRLPLKKVQGEMKRELLFLLIFHVFYFYHILYRVSMSPIIDFILKVLLTKRQ